MSVVVPSVVMTIVRRRPISYLAAANPTFRRMNQNGSSLRPPGAHVSERRPGDDAVRGTVAASPPSTSGSAERNGVRFGHFGDAFAGYEATLKALIESHGCRSICEVGGGANPALPLSYLTTKGIRHCLLDVAPEELAKSPVGYEKIVADICSDTPVPGGPFDLVVSKMLAEHVRRPRQFHRNVRSLLRPGGLAFHFFPTLYALPFVANSLLPERGSAAALRFFSPRDPVTQRKFPAYYHWCRGPTASQIRRFERIGYVVEQYIGFFGHGYYARIPGLRILHRLATGYLVRHPVPLLTSFAYVILRKAGPEVTDQ